MESLLRNVCVAPLTSRQIAIVFTGSGFLHVKAVFLLNEAETSKINARFVFYVAVYVELEKLVVLGLHAL